MEIKYRGLEKPIFDVVTEVIDKVYPFSANWHIPNEGALRQTLAEAIAYERQPNAYKIGTTVTYMNQLFMVTAEPKFNDTSDSYVYELSGVTCSGIAIAQHDELVYNAPLQFNAYV